MLVVSLSKPRPISAKDEISHFDCGEHSLNDWLTKRALKNQVSGASRCFVVCNDDQVVGYYTISAGAVSRELTLKSMQRNMPNPLPVLLLGRLAIDRSFHNAGLGSALLRDAMLRAVHVSYEAGIFAILVHALSESAKQFYLSRGFIESPIQPMTLIMTLNTIKSVLAEK